MCKLIKYRFVSVASYVHELLQKQCCVDKGLNTFTVSRGPFIQVLFSQPYQFQVPSIFSQKDCFITTFINLYSGLESEVTWKDKTVTLVIEYESLIRIHFH